MLLSRCGCGAVGAEGGTWALWVRCSCDSSGVLPLTHSRREKVGVLVCCRQGRQQAGCSYFIRQTSRPQRATQPHPPSKPVLALPDLPPSSKRPLLPKQRLQVGKVLGNDPSGRAAFVHSGGLAAVQQMAEAPGSKLKEVGPCVCWLGQAGAYVALCGGGLAAAHSWFLDSLVVAHWLAPGVVVVGHPALPVQAVCDSLHCAGVAPGAFTTNTLLSPLPLPTAVYQCAGGGDHKQRVPRGDCKVLQPHVQPAATGEAGGDEHEPSGVLMSCSAGGGCNALDDVLLRGQSCNFELAPTLAQSLAMLLWICVSSRGGPRHAAVFRCKSLFTVQRRAFICPEVRDMLCWPSEDEE